eukprot:CAMPEP_0198258148 /NCGR_PEP_ID=MMETSP1447-20131203/7651_1 /TAXON_ID=420782 /ORGANISM="Chaetoceros dichaeta, Strain CCMP1751" /LENGTH=110 /DNA_ID=CAMNT_0043945213 /DNA_START=1025 /DNA_END=1358 /DNA_ORIENTATION=-
MAHAITNIYHLYVQVQCAEVGSQGIFCDRAVGEEFGFVCRERGRRSWTGLRGCGWGLELECKIFHLTAVSSTGGGGVIVYDNDDGVDKGNRGCGMPKKRKVESDDDDTSK